MRRVWVRGHENVRKRVLIQAAACNIGLLLRHQTGVGTPRSLQIGSLIPGTRRVPLVTGAASAPRSTVESSRSRAALLPPPAVKREV